MTPRNVARKVWEESGYDYSVLTENNLLELVRRINANLNDHRVNEVPEFKMWLHYNHKKNGSIYYDSYSENGRLIWVEITVDGEYFKNREGITFNRDGFIGFAGWACDDNVQPFIRAFIEWIQWMKDMDIQNDPEYGMTKIPIPETESVIETTKQTLLEQYGE